MRRKPERIEPPAPRRPDFEAAFCNAIRKKLIVDLRYKNDLADRTFAPYAVFYSRHFKVCVCGAQLGNPSKPEDDGKPHDFEIGRVISVRLTDRSFAPDSWFNQADERYQNGIICSVE